MRSRLLPAFCTSGRTLAEVAGVIVHYFSGRNVDPAHEFEPEVCRNLFIDLNRPKAEREWYMREDKWPATRMYASAHLLIGRDGESWQLVSFDKQAYHAGYSILDGRRGCNAFTLGIELVGGINSGFTREQYAELAARLIELEARYGFSRDHIAGHDTVRHAAIDAGITAKKKYDPSGRSDGKGDNFNWMYLGKLMNDLKPNPAGVAGLDELDQLLEADVAPKEPEPDGDAS